MDEGRVRQYAQLRRRINRNLQIHSPRGACGRIGKEFGLYTLFQHCDRDMQEKEKSLSPEEQKLFQKLIK